MEFSNHLVPDHLDLCSNTTRLVPDHFDLGIVLFSTVATVSRLLRQRYTTASDLYSTELDYVSTDTRPHSITSRVLFDRIRSTQTQLVEHTSVQWKYVSYILK